MIETVQTAREYQYDWQNPKYIKPEFNFGRVLSRAYKGLFSIWKPVGLAILCTIGLNIILGLVSLGLTGHTSLDATGTSASASAEAAAMLLTIPLTVLSYVFVMIVTDAGLFAKVTDQPVRFSQLARKALRKSIPLFFGLILFFIAYYIGVLLFIVPGIFIYYGWGIFGPVYVNEAGGLFASFGRSWTLMKGYKRWHFLVSFVCGMINSIVILVLFFITFLPFAPFLDFATGEFDTANMMILLFASVLITVSFYLYACLTASMTTAIYLEVKALKEGAGHDNLAEVFA